MCNNYVTCVCVLGGGRTIKHIFLNSSIVISVSIARPCLWGINKQCSRTDKLNMSCYLRHVNIVESGL